MKATRYATSRQKACLHCSTAKAKCDRKPGRCSRCTLRSLSCTYPQALPSGGSASSANASGEVGLNSLQSASNVFPAVGVLLPSPEAEPSAGTGSSTVESGQLVDDSSPTNASSMTFTGGHIPIDAKLNTTSRPPGGSETPNFADVDLSSSRELVCPINADDISNRWLSSYVPVPGQRVKEYPAPVAAFMHRTLNSYAAATVRGRGVPPFVHASQLTATATRPPLSTCLTLVRVCERLLPGSEGAAADVLQREMNGLYEQQQQKHSTCGGDHDYVASLAAFQAYLIYALVLFFRLGQGHGSTGPFLRQAMTNLQELACASSRRGLVCAAEQRRARPGWEAWIVAEAKRRTLFVMYLFDGVLLARDGLPNFFGTELRGLPAPAGGSLWRAGTRREWEAAYNLHLADWVGGGLRIDELWPIPAELDEAGVVERRGRVDRWLEGVDEFGTMLYAVTSCTHGG